MNILNKKVFTASTHAASKLAICIFAVVIFVSRISPTTAFTFQFL